MTVRAILVLLLMFLVLPVAQAGDLQRFVVDNERSWIRILVYRAGLMSVFGHNHVVASHDISGTVECSDQLIDTVVELFFPVELLVVDAAELRNLEGDDFLGQVSEKDIGGTRKNMLGRKVLDAENHAMIRVRSTEIGGEPGSLIVTADMMVAGQTNSITFPASVVLSGDEIIVSGTARISHKELGLKPFSAAFGTLKVHQDMTVRFEITAVLE
jgi:hypothetical protein